jgi:large subunit ribosomal protein L23
MKNPYEILEKPVLSEKSLALGERDQDKQYVFKVHIKANKKEIKKAVEEAFSVHVARVNTTRVQGKPRRVRYQPGFRSDWKKAYITLKEGETINLI